MGLHAKLFVDQEPELPGILAGADRLILLPVVSVRLDFAVFPVILFVLARKQLYLQNVELFIWCHQPKRLVSTNSNTLKCFKRHSIHYSQWPHRAVLIL